MESQTEDALQLKVEHLQDCWYLKEHIEKDMIIIYIDTFNKA